MDRGRSDKQQCSALAYVHVVVWVMARVPGLQLRPLIRALSCRCKGQRGVTATTHQRPQARTATDHKQGGVGSLSCIFMALAFSLLELKAGP